MFDKLRSWTEAPNYILPPQRNPDTHGMDTRHLNVFDWRRQLHRIETMSEPADR